jgi:hypothetical protein
MSNTSRLVTTRGRLEDVVGVCMLLLSPAAVGAGPIPTSAVAVGDTAQFLVQNPSDVDVPRRGRCSGCYEDQGLYSRQIRVTRSECLSKDPLRAVSSDRSSDLLSRQKGHFRWALSRTVAHPEVGGPCRPSHPYGVAQRPASLDSRETSEAMGRHRPTLLRRKTLAALRAPPRQDLPATRARTPTQESVLPLPPALLWLVRTLHSNLFMRSFSGSTVTT